MIHYLLDYGCYSLGVLLYLLGKVKEYKAMAKANPDPKVVYDTRHFISDEWINFAQISIYGVALVVFMPMLIGGATVDVKSAEGVVITNIDMKTLLAPFYFVTGIAGSSGVMAIFGKYKRTLYGRVGVDSN